MGVCQKLMRRWRGFFGNRVWFFGVAAAVASLSFFVAEIQGAARSPKPDTAGIQEDRKTFDQMLAFSVGPGFGTSLFGGKLKRDFIFFNAQYGHMISDSIAEKSRWEGRWMLIGELTVGRERDPKPSWAVSFAPLARYHFEAFGSLVPFVEAGAGLTWTNIGEPDLGGEQQFNVHAGGGLLWFVRPNFAYSLQYRFVHYSNAGLRSPNRGVNVNAGLVGVGYFF